MTARRFRTFPRALLCVLALAVFGLLSAQQCLAQGERAITENYQLASGDILKINVFGHTDVSGDFEVDGTGQITFPLLGLVRAEGLTIEQLRSRVEQDLNRDYIVEPRVSVEVLNFRPIFILGQVGAPGSYPYSVGMTVRQAVALAGGYTRRASTSDMKLIRIENGLQKELEVQEENTILPGDTIEVLRRFF
ncbi:MAG: polysaccharide biosynthesis/export family protein [Rhodovibrionaceae bacterium]